MALEKGPTRADYLSLLFIKSLKCYVVSNYPGFIALGDAGKNVATRAPPWTHQKPEIRNTETRTKNLLRGHSHQPEPVAGATVVRRVPVAVGAA